jgi:hypothetical protein
MEEYFKIIRTFWYVLHRNSKNEFYIKLTFPLLLVLSLSLLEN